MSGPKESGMLRGGGVRHGRPKYTGPDTPWAFLSRKDTARIKREVPDFDPTVVYSKPELEMITEKILLEDTHDGPMWLNGAMYKERIRREIYVASGTPDPSIVEGLYNRTHPQGRKVNTEEQRKYNGAGFYR